MSDNNILSGLAEYLRRSGRNLARMPGDTYSALADVAGRVPHLPFAEDGIQSYGGAVTGYDTPYYGDDEISAAREYFDRQPRSNTSRLSELFMNAMPGPATGPKAFQLPGRANPAKAPEPTDLDEAKAIMQRFREIQSENQGVR
jgi:hypothetical protein